MIEAYKAKGYFLMENLGRNWAHGRSYLLQPEFELYSMGKRESREEAREKFDQQILYKEHSVTMETG